MEENLIYTVQFTYIDTDCFRNNDMRTFNYSTYEKAVEKLKYYRDLELNACEEFNKSYNLMTDEEDEFTIYLNFTYLLDVRINCQELDKHPFDELM